VSGPLPHASPLVEFRDVNLQRVHVFVDGDVLLGDSTGGGAIVSGMRVPNTAALEYPYWPPSSPTQWPCIGKVNTYGCSSSADLPGSPPIQLLGFLGVNGTLSVANSTAAKWTIDGAVAVGNRSQPAGSKGDLNFAGSAGSLTIYYDDEVNHSIHVTPAASSGTSPIALMTDSLRDIPAK